MLVSFSLSLGIKFIGKNVRYPPRGRERPTARTTGVARQKLLKFVQPIDRDLVFSSVSGILIRTLDNNHKERFPALSGVTFHCQLAVLTMNCLSVLKPVYDR